jgi:hypothetical protein
MQILICSSDSRFHNQIVEKSCCAGKRFNDFLSKTIINKQLIQNWHGPGESDCLIKTKHCDGPNGC